MGASFANVDRIERAVLELRAQARGAVEATLVRARVEGWAVEWLKRATELHHGITTARNRELIRARES